MQHVSALRPISNDFPFFPAVGEFLSLLWVAGFLPHFKRAIPWAFMIDEIQLLQNMGSIPDGLDEIRVSPTRTLGYVLWLYIYMQDEQNCRLDEPDLASQESK